MVARKRDNVSGFELWLQGSGEEDVLLSLGVVNTSCLRFFAWGSSKGL